MRYRAERCLSRRYPGFTCDRCQEVCPRGLPAAGELPPDCDDCGLCVRACPGGAYRGEGAGTLPARPAGRSLHLGCPRTLGGPCLAAVADGLLLTAALAYPGGVSLDVSGCPTCDVPGRDQVTARVERLNRALTAAGWGTPLGVATEGGPWPEIFDGSGGAPDRRELLTSLLPVLSFFKRSPGRIWDALGRGPADPFPGLDRGAEVSLNSGACDGCGLCHRICPADALRQEGGEMLFSAEACRGCGLCAELCTRGALVVTGPASLAAFASEWRVLGPLPARTGRPATRERAYLEIWP